MNSTGVDLSAITQQIQQLQQKADQLNQIQNVSNTPQAQPKSNGPTYPRIAREPESVEDILENPQWRQELQTQFFSSETGTKVKSQMDLLFSEFCEKATGYKSTMLEDLRRQSDKAKKAQVPRKPAEESKNGGES